MTHDYERKTTDTQRTAWLRSPQAFDDEIRDDILSDLAACESALAAARKRVEELERERDEAASDHAQFTLNAVKAATATLAVERDALRAEVERYKSTAVALWGLLDNIDTSDDACRDNDVAFRRLTREQINKRHGLLVSDGYALTLPAAAAIRQERAT